MKDASGSWEFAFMAATPTALLKPRKQPVQARSEATVAAIFEATIQVLLAVGYRQLTTTRVAERAGVSVGTLYQYFPNRQALIAAVIERHLEETAALVEHDCRTLAGRSLDEMAAGLVDAIIKAKCQRIEISRAMQEPLADIGGVPLVKAAANKAAAFVAEMLTDCRDAAFDDVHRLAFLIVTSCRSLLQSAIVDRASSSDMAALRTHMRAMVHGYLKEMQRVPAQIRRTKGAATTTIRPVRP
jgi:AcrR family transcriptional regulator